MIKTNIIKIKQEIEETCKIINRNPKTVFILAASKSRTTSEIEEVLQNGIGIIGESKVQELKEKLFYLPKEIKIDFIGHIQTNKVKEIVQYCSLIHSVDSLRIAEKINQEAGKINKKQAILLEVNVGQEETKFGFNKDDIVDIFPKIIGLKNISVKGLMMIAPNYDYPENSRQFFQELRQIKKQLENKFQVFLPELSMGMSNDFKIAIEEGATIIRLGRIIFD